LEIVIKNNRFVCRIYDMDSFIEMPLKNVRKLWKLMFAEPWRNEISIESLRQWLPNIHAQLGAELATNEFALVVASQNAEELRRTAAAFGSHKLGVEARKAAKAALGDVRRAESALRQSKREVEKAEKLHRIFAELSP